MSPVSTTPPIRLLPAALTAGPRVQTDTTVTDGSFKIEGDTIHFAVPHSRRRIATMTGGLLVVPVDGMTWVFRRS
jgi:hypothetical protein